MASHGICGCLVAVFALALFVTDDVEDDSPSNAKRVDYLGEQFRTIVQAIVAITDLPRDNESAVTHEECSTTKLSFVCG